jgi:hypothetical protein
MKVRWWGTYNAWERRKPNTEFSSRNKRERDHLRNLGVGKRISEWI